MTPNNTEEGLMLARSKQKTANQTISSEWRASLVQLLISTAKQENYDCQLLGGLDFCDGSYLEGGDIDIYVKTSTKNIIKLVINISKATNCTIINCIKHSGYGVQFHIDNDGEALILDIYASKWRGGNFVFSFRDHFPKNCLSDSEKLSAALFDYIVVKRISKNSFSESNISTVVHLLKQNRINLFLEGLVSQSIGMENTRYFINKSLSNDTLSKKEIASFHSLMRNSSKLYSPLATPIYHFSNINNTLNKILNPPGLHIAFLGPDGAGKSTVIEHCKKNLSPTFRNTNYFHLRPKLLGKKRNGETVTDPHGTEPRNAFTSIAKIGFFLFDYVFGWVLKILPRLAKSNLVIFDRYYHDILVDPKRYRYGGPKWAIKFAGLLVPKPDLWILLDAPAEVLQNRAGEVSMEESQRQRQAYLKLFQNLNDAIAINANQEIDQVVADVNKAVRQHMANRTEKRLGH